MTKDVNATQTQKAGPCRYREYNEICPRDGDCAEHGRNRPGQCVPVEAPADSTQGWRGQVQQPLQLPPTPPLMLLLAQWERGGFTLPVDSAERKRIPVHSGCYAYFPAALAAVAAVSMAGNDKHNPGQPLHWSQDKSTDHADCEARHAIDRGDDPEEPGHVLNELAAKAWRALAELQMFAQAQGAPVPPGAKAGAK